MPAAPSRIEQQLQPDAASSSTSSKVCHPFVRLSSGRPFSPALRGLRTAARLGSGRPIRPAALPPDARSCLRSMAFTPRASRSTLIVALACPTLACSYAPSSPSAAPRTMRAQHARQWLPRLRLGQWLCLSGVPAGWPACQIAPGCVPGPGPAQRQSQFSGEAADRRTIPGPPGYLAATSAADIFAAFV